MDTWVFIGGIIMFDWGLGSARLRSPAAAGRVPGAAAGVELLQEVRQLAPAGFGGGGWGLGNRRLGSPARRRAVRGGRGASPGAFIGARWFPRFPGEPHAVDGAAGHSGIQAADFGEHLAAGGEAVGAGVGAGELGERGEALDGNDADAAEARDVGALAGLDAGVMPEADGLGLAAGADEVEEAGFEKQHARIVHQGGRNGTTRNTKNTKGEW